MKAWAALLAGFGLVGVGFGLLSLFVWLIFYDPVAQSLAESLSVGVIGNLVVGVLLLTAALFMSFDQVRERLQSGEGRRIGRHGVSAVVSAVLILAILGGLAFLSTRYNKRIDVSDDQVNTLTEQTVNLLNTLETPVVITAFFEATEAPGVADLMDRYAYQSDLVTVEYVDPNAMPGLVEDLDLDPDALARGLVRVSSGEDAVLVDEFGESQLTNALLKLTRQSDKTVYFVSGHNERPVADAEGAVAQAKESMGRASVALRNETYGVEILQLATVGDVPEDADVVIIAGPTQPLLEQELDVLRRYIARGGALMVMIDPRARTNLYDDLARWGVRLGDDVVVDRSLALFGQATSPFAGVYAEDHPITADMIETSLFPMVRSVIVDRDSEIEVIVSTSADSWAERDLDGWRQTGRASLGPEDLAGPVPIAAAGLTNRVDPALVDGEDAADAAGTAGPVERGRIVVFGDSDFASNEYIDSFRNRDLFLNSVNWLLGDVEQIALRPNVARATRHRLSVDDFQRLQTLSLFVVPQLIAMIGVLAWWMRRDRAER
jgi:ABC-type uncharacterized transport system involved in gliding motility auxiliary subunit